MRLLLRLPAASAAGARHPTPSSTTSLLHFASTVTVPGERSNTQTFCLKIANFCKFLCNLKSFWNCASHTLDHLYKSRVCIFCASRSSPFAPPKTLPLAHLYKSRCAFFCASLMPNKRTHFKPKVCNKVVGVWETVSKLFKTKKQPGRKLPPTATRSLGPCLTST